MSSAREYKVGLDALDQVTVKLNGVLKGLQETKGRAGHSTYPACGIGQTPGSSVPTSNS